MKINIETSLHSYNKFNLNATVGCNSWRKPIHAEGNSCNHRLQFIEKAPFSGAFFAR